LKKNETKLDKYTKSTKKNPLTVLKESMFTPDFSLPDTIEEQQEIHNEILFKDLIKRVSIMLKSITELSSEITHDYYDEYTFKRFLQEQWDTFLDTIEEKKIVNKKIKA
jgi:hypothetical protein